MADLLDVKNLSVSVEEKAILDAVNLTINKGETHVLMGPNGAGKSTLMNVIAGVLFPDSGTVVLDGVDVTKDDVTKRSRDISRVFQDPKMGTATRMTIEQNMAIALKRGKSRSFSLGVKKEDRELYKTSLEELGLGLENRLKSSVEFLSGGQRQALTLVMSTLVKPKLLLLDEHTAALDPKTSAMVMKLTDKIVKKNNLTTVMITHNMEHAIEYGNRLVMLHEGHVVVDIKSEEKKDLTVAKLLELFKKNSGSNIINDDMML